MANAIRPHVDLGLKPEPGGNFTLDVDRLDQGRLASGAFEWVNVTPRTVSIAISRGRTHMQDAISPGTALVTLNNHADELVPDDFKTGRNPIRIGAGPGGPWFFHGTVESSFWRADIPSQTVFLDLGCQDYTRALQSTQLPARAGSGFGETASQRANRILDELDEPARSYPRFGTGNQFFSRAMQGTTLARPLLGEMAAAADVDAGTFHTSKNGGYVFLSGPALDVIATVPPDYQIGIDTNYPVRGGTEQVSRDRVLNDVQLTRLGGSALQRQFDEESIAIYGRRSLSQTVETNDDEGALELAKLYLSLFRDASTQYTPIELHADRGDNAQLIRDLELYDVVQLRFADYETAVPPSNLLTPEDTGFGPGGGSWAPIENVDALGYGNSWPPEPSIGTGYWRLEADPPRNPNREKHALAGTAQLYPATWEEAPFTVSAVLRAGAGNDSFVAAVGVRVIDVDANETVLWGPLFPIVPNEWRRSSYTVPKGLWPQFSTTAGPVVGIYEPSRGDELFFDAVAFLDTSDDPNIETGYVERITHQWRGGQDVWMSTIELNTAWHDRVELE